MQTICCLYHILVKNHLFLINLLFTHAYSLIHSFLLSLQNIVREFCIRCEISRFVYSFFYYLRDIKTKYLTEFND